MDAITPVATEIQPPSIQQGMSSLASILGISQQQLAVQQQRQQVLAATAEAQQAQQRNQEMQQAQALAIKPPLNADGSLNRQALADQLTRLGPYAAQNANQVLDQANEVAQNNLYKQNLSQDRQNQLSQGLTGLASDPNFTPQKLKSWAVNQIDLHPGDDDFKNYMLSMLMHFPSSASPQQQRQIVQGWAAQFSGQPVQTPTQINTGAAIIPGATNRFNGAFSPASTGQPESQIPLQPGPTQTPAYIAAATSAQTRAGGVANIDTQRASQVSAAIQPSTAGIQLSNQVDDLADQIFSGKFTSSISKAAAAVGLQSATYARQLLAKDLGQLKTLAIRNAPSDQAAGTIESGYPEATSDTRTIHTAMDYIRGGFQQNLARGKLLNQYQQQHPDLVGFQHADDAYTSKYNPLASEYMALPAGAARQGFLRRNFRDAQQAQAFVDSLK